VMPVFIRGHPGVLPSILDEQAVQVVFNLEHSGPAADGEVYLHASLLSIATV
jgi:hypothetical protein